MMKNLVILNIICVMFTTISAQTVYANDITVFASCSLADAIRAANTDSAVGTCPAGNGADTIRLTRNITLDAELPQITSEITIEGGGYTISGDSAYRIFYIGNDGTLSLNNTTVTNGKAANECPYFNSKGNEVGTTYYPCGGAIVNLGNLAIGNSAFTGNSAAGKGGTMGEGGAISSLVKSNLTISNSAFTGNSTAGEGGAISSWSNLTISNSAFTDNSAENGGAIIHNIGELTVIDSAFTGNSAENRGGAIFGLGNLSISNSAFTDNSAENGGAISSFGELTVSNSTFTHNSARDPYYRSFGGAIVYSGTTTLTHVTIARNSADSGGGGFTMNMGSRDGLNLRNSIIALNSGGDCHGVLNQDIGNLIQDGSCLANNSGNPSFGKLVEPTEGLPAYLSLVIGSAAIDAAHPAYCMETDQRGVARPQGDACDIGAYEYVPDA
ncbi:MAG: hypothetical protein OXE52_03290 [Chloroflexi bacterium]|nr:hypothetical protein [Chloroflexota bacterium]